MFYAAPICRQNEAIISDKTDDTDDAFAHLDNASPMATAPPLKASASFFKDLDFGGLHEVNMHGEFPTLDHRLAPTSPNPKQETGQARRLAHCNRRLTGQH